MILFVEFYALNITNKEIEPKMEKPLINVPAASGGIAFLVAWIRNQRQMVESEVFNSDES
jgi:hypothetical protein